MRSLQDKQGQVLNTELLSARAHFYRSNFLPPLQGTQIKISGKICLVLQPNAQSQKVAWCENTRQWKLPHKYTISSTNDGTVDKECLKYNYPNLSRGIIYRHPNGNFTLQRSEIRPVEFTSVRTTPLQFVELFTRTHINQKYFPRFL